MAKLRDLLRPMPFCRICFRYMTPAEARKHSTHAKAIRWPR